MKPEISDRLLAIRALAERGSTPGERAAAQGKLDMLLKRYNLTYADLDDCAIKLVWFTARRKDYKQLLHQLVGAVCNWPEKFTYYIERGKPSKVGYKLTRAQNAEISALYPILRKVWDQHMRTLKSAFLSANSLLAPLGYSREIKPLSSADIAEIENVNAMKSAVNMNVRHQLSEGKIVKKSR